MFFKTQHKNYGLTALRAKGRMKKGELNRTESAYAMYLEVKCKSVATQYPFALFVAYPRSKRQGGGFDVIPYPGK